MLPSRILFRQLYKAKRPWPPDLSMLTQKHQFSLERRYRRRAKLKWARPRLQKTVRIMQLSGAVFVLMYSVFWADWGKNPHPFGPIRGWAANLKDSFWTTPSPARPGLSTRPRNQASLNDPERTSS